MVTNPSDPLKLPIRDVGDQARGVETVRPQYGVSVSTFPVNSSVEVALCVYGDLKVQEINLSATVFQAELNIGAGGVQVGVEVSKFLC